MKTNTFKGRLLFSLTVIGSFLIGIPICYAIGSVVLGDLARVDPFAVVVMGLFTSIVIVVVSGMIVLYFQWLFKGNINNKDNEHSTESTARATVSRQMDSRSDTRERPQGERDPNQKD